MTPARAEARCRSWQPLATKFQTRHNAGFSGAPGARAGAYSAAKRFHGLAANARNDGVWLLMPQTFK